MLNYLFAILGLAVLCSIWAFFQIFVTKYHPDTAALKSGCAACENGACAEKQPQKHQKEREIYANS